MKLSGSCHCGGVSFELTSKHPYPYNYCYCSVCRKTQGGGGFAINLSGDAESLTVHGIENITIYQVKTRIPESGEVQTSPMKRHFCKLCSSNLWAWHPDWPELIHPFASAIDTELPVAPDKTHLMLAFKAGWVPLDMAEGDKKFDGYPEQSIAQWHQLHDLEC